MKKLWVTFFFKNNDMKKSNLLKSYLGGFLVELP